MISWREAHAVLGVPLNSPFHVVRKAFRRLALQHHPDHHPHQQQLAQKQPQSQYKNAGTSTTHHQYHHSFVRIRTAFETIRARHHHHQQQQQKQPQSEEGNPEQDATNGDEDDDLNFVMTQHMKQEVMHVYQNMSQGGLDKGGFWEMARIITEKQQHQREQHQRVEHNKNGHGCETQPNLTGSRSLSPPTTTPRRRKRQ